MIGSENVRHPLNQSDAKLNTIATASLAFSRASSSWLVFTLSSYWPITMWTFVLIGHMDCFGFTTLNWKLHYERNYWFDKVGRRENERTKERGWWEMKITYSHQKWGTWIFYLFFFLRFSYLDASPLKQLGLGLGLGISGALLVWSNVT